MACSLFVCSALSAQVGVLSAQVSVVSVRPDSTGPSLFTVHGNHFAFTPPAGKAKHKLVLMIEGTGSAARDLFFFDSSIALRGYSVISLDYPNNVITTVCSNSQDSSCFNSFRQEIVFGSPVSPLVQVDSMNCLYNRFLLFLRYLVRNDPGQGWEEYLREDAIQWDKIIVGGHSQGAGHAAYFGKKFKLNRVLIFSGPQDYLNSFFTPASWLYDSSATDVSRYYSFLHTRDPYDFNKQWMNCEALMRIKRSDTGVAGGPDTLMVSPGLSPARTSRRIFVTNIPTNDPHGSTLGPNFQELLGTMLEGEAPDAER
jgi:pimeloyl-ACP methyl ester carboxylesterase